MDGQTDGPTFWCHFWIVLDCLLVHVKFRLHRNIEKDVFRRWKITRDRRTDASKNIFSFKSCSCIAMKLIGAAIHVQMLLPNALSKNTTRCYPRCARQRTTLDYTQEIFLWTYLFLDAYSCNCDLAGFSREPIAEDKDASEQYLHFSAFVFDKLKKNQQIKANLMIFEDFMPKQKQNEKQLFSIQKSKRSLHWLCLKEERIRMG